MRLPTISLALATTAAALALASAAPAVAAPAAHTQAAAAWHTLRHEAMPAQKGYFTTNSWQRPSGARVMQVKARCWGNDTNLEVKLWFVRNWGGGEKVAKAGTFRCNGRYGYVRISNAGHREYYASFSLRKKHTVEYWVQYYK
ncbi:hypothetical protein MF672_008355 [Actinomadura sp. ATCC 31491]|uniref:Uncharacterized protein n=1 Tax=Actinomadura luzonensis TaxID=2805427 RepID=A0ABT0FN89_9ACTN|nr:hypothetical protein [Actinomadura luzonensis]MCK2213799.1 hypothetical protein [Actinomadura luzonensis]